MISSTCCFTGQAAALVALPFHQQHLFGLGTVKTGFVLSAWPLAVAITGPIAGRLADSRPPAHLCAMGGACLATGLAATALWPEHGGPLPLALFSMVCGVGFGLFNVPNNRTMFLSAPIHRSGAAGGLQGTARLMGQTAGAVLITLLFTLTSTGSAPRIGLTVGAALTLLAGLVSLRPVDSARGRFGCLLTPGGSVSRS